MHDLRTDLDRIAARIATFPGGETLPWDVLWRWGKGNLTQEGQETFLVLILEPHGDVIDDLAEWMSLDETAEFHLNGRMSIGTVRQILAQHYDWALKIDFAKSENQARFWYV